MVWDSYRLKPGFAWMLVLLVVGGLMVVPLVAYGRGGPPDHAQGRPPVSPPVGPPLSPPVGPPLSPPVGPPLSPPVGPPLSPPVGPPLSPPGHGQGPQGNGIREATADVEESVVAIESTGKSEKTTKPKGRR